MGWALARAPGSRRPREGQRGCVGVIYNVTSERGSRWPPAASRGVGGAKLFRGRAGASVGDTEQRAPNGHHSLGPKCKFCRLESAVIAIPLFSFASYTFPFVNCARVPCLTGERVSHKTEETPEGILCTLSEEGLKMRRHQKGRESDQVDLEGALARHVACWLRASVCHVACWPGADRGHVMCWLRAGGGHVACWPRADGETSASSVKPPFG